MARIRLLQVLEANVGGARKHVCQLVRGLDPSRFEVHLACSLERDPRAANELAALNAAGIRTVSVRMLRRPAPLADLAALRALTRLMRAERFDIVHTHASKAGFLGRLAARRAGVRAIVHTPHTFAFERRDTSLAPVYRLLERFASGWAHRIVLVSPSQRGIAERAGVGAAGQLAVVPNGIRLPAADPAQTRRRYRSELGLIGSDLAVGFVARLSPQKDVQVFLAASAALSREWPGVRLFLAGGADDLRYLRALRPAISSEAWAVATGAVAPEARVCWSPELPVEVLGHRPDAPDLVAAFDVVLLPSRYEGLPYSLLEAMAQRVAVVASDVTGNRDAVAHGLTGFLAPAGDAEALARYALELLENPSLRSRMGHAARERVATEFTEETFLRRMAQLYEEVASG